MAIGRYRDVPSEMDDVECEVAAAQYPQSGLVFGLGVGIVLSIATVEVLLVFAPILCGVAGFVLGRRVHDFEIRRRRADRTMKE
ncbi:hypothetical protein [Natrinema halophilum]|uniref:Uncharacterized protein n=1 Tax=Natrinema halophilum TaxID=1699371 RepID=A0A7D5KSA6_9EURY|nr:hypothetical protein [Natrinema halophilum]QLG50177.1 hypothetical protein HYG82_15600 [Natrinema halophilum]